MKGMLMNKSFKGIGPSEIVMLVLFTILSFVLVLIPIEGDAKRASLHYVNVIHHLICISLLTWWGFFCYFRYQKALDLIKSVD